VARAVRLLLDSYFEKSNNPSEKCLFDVNHRYIVDFGDKFESIRYKFDSDIEPFLTGMLAISSVELETKLKGAYRTVLTGEVVVPKNIRELKNYLKDHVPRIVLLNKTFDFTDTEGTTTSDGCYFIECGEGFQYSLEVSDTCNGRRKTQVGQVGCWKRAALRQLGDRDPT
jgi:hypothetical protein